MGFSPLPSNGEEFGYGSIIITFVDPGSNLTILILVIYRSSSSSWRNKNAPKMESIGRSSIQFSMVVFFILIKTI